MITLNTEKGLVKIETWQEIIERPGFQNEVDPTKVELNQIIGSYQFRDYVPCGLSTCHQPHGKGYLVSTKAGHETNIGKDCGKTHFSVDFETLRRSFDRDLRNAQRRESLSVFQNQANALCEEIEDLRGGEFGATWVYSKMKQFNKTLGNLPRAFGEQFRGIVKSGNGEIQVAREATAQEIEDMEAIQNRTIPKPHYINETKGVLKGIECWWPTNDLRELLIVKLRQRIEQIQSVDVDQASERELAEMTKWVEGFPSTLKAARVAINSGKTFFAPENIAQLEQLLADPMNRKYFRRSALKDG